MSWTLEEVSLGQLTLDPEDGYSVVGYDLGYPTVRAVVDDLADGDGEDDLTSYFGGRIVSLDVRTTGTAQERQRAAMTLRRYMEPRRRVTLRWDTPEWGSLRAVGRGDKFANQIGSAMSAQVARCAWRVASGVFESLVELSVSSRPASGSTAGRVYDLTFNRVYPAAAIAGSTLFTAGGTVRAWPTLRLFGPITSPIARLVTSGGYWSFPGLSVIAGDWIEINTRNRTVLLNGGTTSLFSAADFATLRWGWVDPGVNEIGYDGTGISAATELRVTWRDAYL